MKNTTMVTSLYAALLALLYFKISIDTARSRIKNKISLGIGQNNEIEALVSAHSNFASYTPLLLILLYLAESSQQIPVFVIYIIATVFTTGRALHYFTFTRKKMNFKIRRLGMICTLFPLNILALLNIFIFIKNF